MNPDEKNKVPADPDVNLPSESEDQTGTNENAPRRKRVRVKVKRRIRVKKKPSAKKLIRKVAERAFWTIIIVGFVVSLIVMIVQLDIKDERLKKAKQRAAPTRTR